MSELVDITLKGYRCRRCGHQWVPRRIFGEIREPRVCPRCRSPYWNRDKERITTPAPHG